MQWREESIVLSVRNFSETARIVTVFNKSLGKCSGLVKAVKTSIHPGDISDVTWRGKSVDNLGVFLIENIFSPFCHAFKNAPRIFAIDSACTLCKKGLLDRAPHADLFDSLKKFLLYISQDNWIKNYIFFEICMLSEVGYGLNLTKCAVSGETDGLAYLSPRTGRAVTEKIGHRYMDKLFNIPHFFISEGKIPTQNDLFQAINITGHFLKIYFQEMNEKTLPISREYILQHAETAA